MEEVEKKSVTFADVYVKNKVRTLYLDGKSIKEIQEIIGMNVGTWDSAYYMNTHGFRDFMQELKKERFLRLTEKVSDEILKLRDQGNHRLLAIKQKEAEFVRETLLKDFGYSKRIETIGLNINKTEPLDEEQKQKLNKILQNTGNDMQDNTVVVNQDEKIEKKE